MRGGGFVSRAQFSRCKNFLVVYAVAAICLMSAAMAITSARAGTETPAYITAEYTGGSIVVDGSIDRSNLTVNAVYADGTVVEVNNYTLSTEVVLREGENRVAVIYLGKTTTFTVVGKEVVDITASYNDEDITIGNALDARNTSVYVTFSDGSYEQVYDFILENATVMRSDYHDVTVRYGKKSTTLTVYGQKEKPIVALIVTYTGDEVMMGNKIDRNQIYVTATYDDATVEDIVNYEMSTDTPTMLGVNTIVVSYRNKTAVFEIEGVPRTIDALYAEYKGDVIEIGHDVRKADIEVKALYSDGVLEDITDFDLPSPTIYYIGTHTKTVHYMGLTADIYVTGVEEAETSYDNAAAYTASNGLRFLSCMIAVPSGVDSSLIKFTTLHKYQISKALTREVRKQNFIVFDIDASAIEDELPLEMKIYVPADVSADQCVLYYTPDRKTTIGVMEYEITGDDEITLKFYKSGTYILTCETRLVRYLKKR